MRRVTLLVVVVLLAVAPPAVAKMGVQLDTEPASLKKGEETSFMVMLMNEPTNGTGEPSPVSGVRPLVTFRNAETGQVVRVRTGRTGHDGIGFGRVSFPSLGTWAVEIDAPRVNSPVIHGQEFDVGGTTLGRVVETMEPPSPPAPAAASPGSGFPWLPVVIGAGVLLLAAAVRVGPHRLRTALPPRLGGSA
jgi:hypothetical protein